MRNFISSKSWYLCKADHADWDWALETPRDDGFKIILVFLVVSLLLYFTLRRHVELRFEW